MSGDPAQQNPLLRNRRSGCSQQDTFAEKPPQGQEKPLSVEPAEPADTEDQTPLPDPQAIIDFDPGGLRL